MSVRVSAAGSLPRRLPAPTAACCSPPTALRRISSAAYSAAAARASEFSDAAADVTCSHVASPWSAVRAAKPRSSFYVACLSRRRASAPQSERQCALGCALQSQVQSGGMYRHAVQTCTLLLPLVGVLPMLFRHCMVVCVRVACALFSALARADGTLRRKPRAYMCMGGFETW
jgi:hypothetical protein